MPRADREGSSSLEILEFECFEATPGTALLRLATASQIDDDRPPTLVVKNGAELHRLDALPSPANPDGLRRAAYSAPVALIDRQGVTFTLVLFGGREIPLPPPSRRTRHRRAPVAASPRSERELDRRETPELETSPRTRGSATGPLTFEAVLGLCLLVLGTTVAVLILAGAIRPGLAP